MLPAAPSISPAERIPPPPAPAKPLATRYAHALFPTGNPADPVEVRRVFVETLWESASAAAVIEVNAAGELSRDPMAAHILNLNRLASETTLAKKRAAYAAKLANIPAGYCPDCWMFGRAIPRPAGRVCVLAHKHLSAPTAAQRPPQMPVTTTTAGAAPSETKIAA